MNGRREFLKLSAAAFVVPAAAEAEPKQDECQFHADKLADAMMRAHGGRAVVMLDQKAAVAHVFIV